MNGTFPVIVLLLGIICRTSDAGKPNIVFILADDYGYADIGYHDSEIRTPNLDALAAEGVKLENYYVHPLCTPTRASLLSGRYTIHTGLQHLVIRPVQQSGLPLDIPTMADLFRARGYSTHLVGKWHLGAFAEPYLPTNRGFDTFYGFLGGQQDYYNRTTCFQGNCGFDFYDNLEPIIIDNAYSTNLFTTRAIDIINKQDGTKPFFMYYASQAPHSPLQVPSQYTDQYTNIKDQNRRIYAGMTSSMDESVGNITAALRKANLLNNTIIVFSSDNGGAPAFGGYNFPLRGAKRSLWEGGIKAIGFVNSPLLVNHGTTTNELIHVSDWLPTLVGLAGDLTCSESENLDGIDQWKVISEGRASLRNELLVNIDPLEPFNGRALPGAAFDTRKRAAIRIGDYKLITGNPGNGSYFPVPDEGQPILSPDEFCKNLWLFDIINDPLETNDLSREMPETVTMMLERLAFHDSTAVEVIFPSADLNALPSNRGNGFWGPWV